MIDCVHMHSVHRPLEALVKVIVEFPAYLRRGGWWITTTSLRI
ncbi:hypothetical protein R3I93_009657 [Phoxinus phoxinus]|uniref:Uncharacterized protein n=1 Tax=Phoxinus phoxinus TaxID=58324 RepID=A0AAN9D345_9TELE